MFVALLVMPLVLFFIIFPFWGNMLSSIPSFVGVSNYIRMFSNDKIFGKALFNTVVIPIAISFLFVFVFALIIFFIRKKIKVARWVFYLGSVFIGGVTTLIYTLYLSIASFHMTSNLFAAQQTIISHIIDYSPPVFDAINPTNVLFSLYIGILTAFVFWILELIFDIVENSRRKRNVK